MNESKGSGNTVDPAELAHFAALGDWWDPNGSFAPLHRLNPRRLEVIRREALAQFGRDGRLLTPFDGLSLVDIGCGGGLIAEPMARLGFRVTAIDAGTEAIAVAREHAEAAGLGEIDYRVATAEALAASGERFDAVLALEIVEHVVHREAFLRSTASLVKPGGIFIGATINRTARAFALAIVAAEYVLGWLPRGTHDWSRFVRPSEFALELRRAGLHPTRLVGMSYNPLGGSWSLSDDLAVNYMIAAVRR